MDPLLLQTLTNLRDDIQQLDTKLDSLKDEVSDLGKWKAKVIGGSIAASAVVTLIVQVTEIYFNVHK